MDADHPGNLESFACRLTTHGFRIIALSAVAARAAPAMARWLGGGPDEEPITSKHRSTRQMIGKLEVSPAGVFSIRYALMDGRDLLFGNGTSEDTPYVPAPFGPMPGGLLQGGPEVRMRGPTLWAALNLAQERSGGLRPAVLISITQHVNTFAKTCADLMDHWQSEQLPNYSSIDENDSAWTRCLASAADYFTEASVEYRLLKRGIVVHHGQLPPLLARRLKVVIDRGLIRVIIATSTLSEGVNIPVNVVLIPSLYRGSDRMNLQEFTNLIGRAGRPGVSTEGSALVVLPEAEIGPTGREVWSRQRLAYDELVREMLALGGADAVGTVGNANSPLQGLLEAIQKEWATLGSGGSFDEWLARTAVIGEGAANDSSKFLGYLDSLDAILIAALQEVEQLKSTELTPTEVEHELSRIWRYTYAAAATSYEDRLRLRWLVRGRAINQLYPDPVLRRKIYRTSLVPRSAVVLLRIANQLRDLLQSGSNYARLPANEQLEFISKVLNELSAVPAFYIEPNLNAKVDWQLVLHWWLAPGSLDRKKQPKADKATDWFDFASKNFIYRGNWGIGGLISLLMESVVDGEPVRALEIDDWPRSELPWIAFWLKELLSWGTLDPVAAFLLARGNAVDRPSAELDARLYYEEQSDVAAPNDLLDPRKIRAWVSKRFNVTRLESLRKDISIPVSLTQSNDNYVTKSVAVSPLRSGGTLIWLDPAGNIVAKSNATSDWTNEPDAYDFVLNVDKGAVIGSVYLPHRH